MGYSLLLYWGLIRWGLPLGLFSFIMIKYLSYFSSNTLSLYVIYLLQYYISLFVSVRDYILLGILYYQVGNRGVLKSILEGQYFQANKKDSLLATLLVLSLVIHILYYMAGHMLHILIPLVVTNILHSFLDYHKSSCSCRVVRVVIFSLQLSYRTSLYMVLCIILYLVLPCIYFIVTANISSQYSCS